ncbi:N-acetylmuramic acid 6-phosphate etherase [Rhodohalobacter halophilus]|uniref:N-acetylmuramic acid 6-phosphate etherase n=1 Tax=Rhodohalobacter halophilus TaxID=1812810 RepID=UPI00083F9EAC|nr:N-acetylmuramic acid 6-phosphate etherase [Rhodohalobacter halophilus]
MKKDQSLFNQLEKLLTEQRNPASEEIDLADSRQIVSIINSEDKKVAHSVETRLDEIASAIDTIVSKLKTGGRLLYFGAGTSGRLGVLDASECPPTFGTKPETVQGFIAGGKEAMFVAQEGAEDSEEEGRKEIMNAGVTSNDIVVGLAASGRTPYVHGAVKAAAEIGAPTIFVTTVSADQVDLKVDHMIDIPVGPEVIMGSTRMKSATAQKMVLNMFTTGAMILLGKVYQNVMVDLQLTNKKLEERAKRIVMLLAKLSYDEASSYLEKADYHVKTALLMALGDLNQKQAVDELKKHNGFIRRALINLQ